MHVKYRTAPDITIYGQNNETIVVDDWRVSPLLKRY